MKPVRHLTGRIGNWLRMARSAVATRSLIVVAEGAGWRLDWKRM
jgi:hypothetical protein